MHAQNSASHPGKTYWLLFVGVIAFGIGPPAYLVGRVVPGIPPLLLAVTACTIICAAEYTTLRRTRMTAAVTPWDESLPLFPVATGGVLAGLLLLVVVFAPEHLPDWSAIFRPQPYP